MSDLASSSLFSVGTNTSSLEMTWTTETPDGNVTIANLTCSASIKLLDEEETIVHEMNVSIVEVPSEGKR